MLVENRDNGHRIDSHSLEYVFSLLISEKKKHSASNSYSFQASDVCSDTATCSFFLDDAATLPDNSFLASVSYLSRTAITR